MSLTYSQAIEKVLRQLIPTQVEQALQVTTNYVAGSGTLIVDHTDPAFAAAGAPGGILANGLNVFYVKGVSNPGTGALNVVGGYQGSVDANITAGTGPAAQVVMSPKFTRWDISQAINDELGALSAPTEDAGLGQIIRSSAITYVPSFMGYALPATFDPKTSKVLEVQRDEPLPWRRNPLIRRDQYRVDRSGYFGTNIAGIILYKRGWPGFPVRVQYLAPFQPLVSLNDDMLTVAGVDVTAQDVVCWGATLRLAPDREIQRNTMGTQPDPRKSTDVPANAIQSSASALNARYLKRIKQEQKRLTLAFPHCEGW